MKNSTSRSKSKRQLRRAGGRKYRGIERRRIGQQMEALESRQMMFGDAIVAIGQLDHVIESPSCIDFEDLPATAAYAVGDTFTADNTGLQADFTGQPFAWSSGTTTSGGFASVEHANAAGHSGQDIAVNNILLDVDFGGTVQDLSLEFGEYGGNLNLRVNGDFRNFEDFQDVNGLFIGGALVSVPTGGFGNDTGQLIVRGPITDFAVGGQELFIDHICARADGEPQGQFDWGDAPDQPYPTLASNLGAHHRIEKNVFLGSRVDGEPNGQPTIAASGDDMANTDDEDGVRFLTPMVPGQLAEVEVEASEDGWLNAWVDFNQDGDWQPTGAENVFRGQLLTAGLNVLSLMVPADARVGERAYSRWRFSDSHKELEPVQKRDDVPNGEVEDYPGRIVDQPEQRFDWGDAPDKPFPTLNLNMGPRHLINPDVFLGTTVDPEADGQPNAMSTGDDAAFSDDEDGVRFLTPLIPGQDAKVEVVASADGWLNAWIDFDRSGSWDTGAENIFNAQPVVAGSNVLTVHVPADAAPGERIYSRWRYSTTHKVLAPVHQAGIGTPDGEVEDHRLSIEEGPQQRIDWGDAPDKPFPTLSASNGAGHYIDPDVFLGTTIDAEIDGQPSLRALGDDAAVVDDEDGVVFLTPIVPGTEATVQVTASTDGRLDAWVDLNQNGSWEPGEQIAVSTPLAAGANKISFVVPKDANPNPLRPVYSRFRFSLDGGLAPTGLARNGEVEDYATLNGDVNGDWRIDAADIDQLCNGIHSGAAAADLNNDGSVDSRDQDYLVQHILGTNYGDANLDRVFDSSDMVVMFTAGEYEDGINHNSTWAEGDFNCDGEFDSSDLVKALSTGTYSASAVAAPSVAVAGAVATDNARPDAVADSSDGAPSKQGDPLADHGRRQLLRAQVTDSIFEHDHMRTAAAPAAALPSVTALDELFATL